MRFHRTVLVCTSLYLPAWASALGAPPQARPMLVFKPIGTVKDVMSSIVDPKALTDAGEAINTACETCHSVYWRQPLAHVTPLPPIPR